VLSVVVCARSGVHPAARSAPPTSADGTATTCAAVDSASSHVAPTTATTFASPTAAQRS
jgi:hypothetical protein